MAKAGVTESFPFDNKTLVFKVMGKMFAITDVERYDFINLKCDPELAVRLREEYEGVTPGYHMNKRLWNSVSTDGSIPDREMNLWINHSYEQIVDSLPGSLKSEITKLQG